MCLGIPGQITEIYQSGPTNLKMAKVNFGGIRKEICLTFTPEAQVGDYVMVHVGFAISLIDQEEAQSTLDLLTEMGEMGEIG